MCSDLYLLDIFINLLYYYCYNYYNYYNYFSLPAPSSSTSLPIPYSIHRPYHTPSFDFVCLFLFFSSKS